MLIKTLIVTTISLCALLSALAAKAADAEAVNAQPAKGKVADTNIQVEVTRIKANKEQPNVLYVVPWKEMESSKDTEQKLVLHDFFGNIYDPVLPAYSENLSETPEKNQ